MLNERCQDGVQQEAVAGIAGPMSGVKGEPFDKGASGETPGSGQTEPGWNELPKSMAELALLWSLSLKGKECSVGWGNGQLRSPEPWEPILFPSPGRYQLHCCTMSTLPHHLLLDSPPCMSLARLPLCLVTPPPQEKLVLLKTCTTVSPNLRNCY